MPPARLYREDLERIVSTLTQNYSYVHLTTFREEIRDIDRLPDFASQRLGHVVFSAGGQRQHRDFEREGDDLQLHLSSASDWIEIADASNHFDRGVAEILRDILRGRTSPLARLTTGDGRAVLIGSLASVGVLLLGIRALATDESGDPVQMPPALVIVSALAAALGLAFWIANRSTRGRIYVTSRTEHRSWWSENGSKLTIEVAKAITNGAVGFFLGYLFTR